MVLDLTINEKGKEFYNFWKRDSTQSFIIALIAIVFIGTCFYLIVGLSLKFFFVISFPVFVIVLGFIYTPLFGRKKYLNKLVKNISMNQDVLMIETYVWFNYKPIHITSNISDVKISEIKVGDFFKDKKVLLVEFENKRKAFYLIEDFFDDSDTLLNILNPLRLLPKS